MHLFVRVAPWCLFNVNYVISLTLDISNVSSNVYYCGVSSNVDTVSNGTIDFNIGSSAETLATIWIVMIVLGLLITIGSIAACFFCVCAAAATGATLATTQGGATGYPGTVMVQQAPPPYQAGNVVTPYPPQPQMYPPQQQPGTFTKY